MKKRHFPDESVATRSTPDSMNTHLRSVWYDIRNTISRDQMGVEQSLANIKIQKAQIKFFQERIVTNFDALDALEGVS